MVETLMKAVAAAALTAAIIAAVVCGILLSGNGPALTISNRIAEITRWDEVILRGEIGVFIDESTLPEPCTSNDTTVIECHKWSSFAKLEVRLEEEKYVTCHQFTWRATTKDAVLQDCYNIVDAHWFGSAAMFYQRWPISEWDQPMTMYASADIYANSTYYGSVLERYWLSSKGIGIRVSHNTPLHVSVNHTGDGKICFRAEYSPSYSTYPNPNNNFPFLDYKMCTASDIREVHDYMSKRFVKNPTGLPDTRMIRSPIWSTWARYKNSISQDIILSFANEILDNGFNNSQLEIDNGYSGLNYGDFIFNETQFPNPAKMVQDLHDLGFRVTLWVTPFANPNSAAYGEGETGGFWVTDQNGATGQVDWWNGNRAAMLDVTNPEAVDWFVGRLKEVQNDTGIDSFKFDAGETYYLGSYFTTEQLVNPCEYTTEWVKLAAQLGTQVEVRAAFESQNQPMFVRMMDKDSVWDWDNGLKTIITTALTYSVLGYSYVLPDMIGGNAYFFGGTSDSYPAKDLYIRWLQLTTFLPAMQYSISPWQYNDTEVVDIALRWTTFHEDEITPKLIDLAEKEAIPEGKPMIRPLWWIAPTDEEALVNDSEFLVGSDLLVAPIVEEGALARDVYLPAGRWRDELHDTVHEGGQWIRDVSVPLSEALYYTKV